MSDHWVRHVLSGRMNGKTTKLDTATRTALDNGHHVHVADQDGTHCLADHCDSRLSTCDYYRGSGPCSMSPACGTDGPRCAGVCDTCGCAEHSCAADCDCCPEHEKGDQ